MVKVMVKRIWQFLVPPPVDEYEKTRLVQTLYTVLFIVVSIWSLVTIYYSFVYFDRVVLQAGLISVLFGVFCLLLVHQHFLDLPRVLVPLASLSALIFMSGKNGGIHDTALVAIGIPMLIAALLLGKRGALAITILSMIAIWALYYGQMQHFFVPRPKTLAGPQDLFSDFIVLLSMLALLWWIMSSLAKGIVHARKNEIAAEEAYTKLSEAQRVAHLGLWDFELGTNTLQCSDEIGKIFEMDISAPGLSRSRLLECIHSEDQAYVASSFDEVLRRKGPYDITYRLYLAGERIKYLHERLAVSCDSQGRPVRCFGIVQDITETQRKEEERERLEAQLIQAQKMESVGRLAGGIAHDFNNLLTAILGHAELSLMFHKDLPTALQKSLKEIHATAERAKTLTRQLLAFGRKQTLEVRAVHINEIIVSFGRIIQRMIGEDIEVKTVLNPAVPMIMADTAQIEQILMNLVINARDAMPSGGEITVETKSINLDASYAATHPMVTAGAYVLLSVTDTGSGMDAETQKMIFEPFFTTKESGKGTGLGLSTVYGIVKQHGGHVLVYSEPGQGTIFRVYFPAISTPAEEVHAPVESSAPPHGNETILLAEDELSVRQLGVLMLSSLGYTVLEAANGEEAFRFASQEGGIDLLLTDVVMPGMGGRETYQKIAAIRPGIKLLYVSGYPSTHMAPARHPGRRHQLSPETVHPSESCGKSAGSAGRVIGRKSHFLDALRAGVFFVIRRPMKRKGISA